MLLNKNSYSDLLKGSASLLFILCIVTSCTSSHQKKKVNNQAQELNKKGMKIQINAPGNRDSLRKALSLLDSAIEIQPDDDIAYWNKLIVLKGLGAHQKYLKTLQKLEKLNLRPIELPYIKTAIGLSMERQGMDSTKAIKKYEEADSLYQVILDTLTQKSHAFWSVQQRFAINLTLLHKDEKKKQWVKKLEKLAKKDSDQLQLRMVQTLSEQTISDIKGEHTNNIRQKK